MAECYKNADEHRPVTPCGSGRTLLLLCCWHWLSILCKLCTVIERHAEINWHFLCIISLNLCTEYLNMATIKISFLLLIRAEYFDILKAILLHHIQQLHTVKNGRVDGPPCNIPYI